MNHTSVSRTSDKRYIASVDVGTTNILCQIYTQDLTIAGRSVKSVTQYHPTSSRYELDPEELWTIFREVVNEAIQSAGLHARDIDCMGIAVQRNSFLLWDRNTGKPRTPVITWQDLRAAHDVKEWNKSYYFKFFQAVCRFTYWLTRNTRYLVASFLRFKSAQVAMRLHHILRTSTRLANDARHGSICCGCLESWFLWKLTEGRVFATDYSCASAYGIYDSFTLEWSSAMMSMLKIPVQIMPDVMNTNADFGLTGEEFFGARIPIRCLIGDQQAATVAETCLQPGQAKITLGTGSFINLNTGTKAHASVKGMYPVIGWKIGEQVTYLAEGHHRDTGTTIEWLKNLELFSDYAELTSMAESVSNMKSSDVYFAPTFNGLEVPVNDDLAACLMIGMRAWTTRAEMVHSVLEAIVMMTKQLVDVLLEETGYRISILHANGNVSSNDWVMQRLADLLQIPVKRGEHEEATCLGAAMLAGLGVGIWKTQSQLEVLRKDYTVFKPRLEEFEELNRRYQVWCKAVTRGRSWYDS